MCKSDTDQRPLEIVQDKDESEDHALARFMLSPALQSAWTLREYDNSNLDLQALVDCLECQMDLVEGQNLARIDQMLLSQAFTLDAIANSLFRRSKNQEYLTQLEAYMKLGLRAQNQCRTTLEALVNMKNPKTYLNQTNIAHNQQVNNRLEKQNAPNELLEKTDGERLEPGKAETAIRGDSSLATVDAKHRAANG